MEKRRKITHPNCCKTIMPFILLPLISILGDRRSEGREEGGGGGGGREGVELAKQSTGPSLH